MKNLYGAQMFFFVHFGSYTKNPNIISKQLLKSL